jgi:hypothetical protein
MKKIILCLSVLLGFTMNGQFVQGTGGVGSNKASLATAASGYSSTAMGDGTTASGDYSTAMGYNTTASGFNSVAMGFNTTASGSGGVSTAMGSWSIASGFRSTAMGYSSTASGDNSTAMGAWTTASGDNSTAMGYSSTASGDNSTAMGAWTTASGDNSTAMGHSTTASGDRSSTMGDNTTASDYGSLSIGSYNSVNSSVTTGGSATAFNTANAAFVIGNGTWLNQSDAFVVYFNGDATLAGDLTINSDARLKDNIQPLGSTLNKLHHIEGKTYSLKKDEEHTPKIGVLAQEVQAVFPELVTEGADGILSVNYQGLVPVLINAINEQDAKMSEQDAKIAALEAQNAEIKELKEMVRVLALQQSQTTSSVAVN